jgi:hypothetical protein
VQIYDFILTFKSHLTKKPRNFSLEKKRPHNSKVIQSFYRGIAGQARNDGYCIIPPPPAPLQVVQSARGRASN